MSFLRRFKKRSFYAFGIIASLILSYFVNDTVDDSTVVGDFGLQRAHADFRLAGDASGGDGDDMEGTGTSGASGTSDGCGGGGGGGGGGGSDGGCSGGSDAGN